MRATYWATWLDVRIICRPTVRRCDGVCVPYFSSYVMKSISGSSSATHQPSTDCAGSQTVTKNTRPSGSVSTATSAPSFARTTRGRRPACTEAGTRAYGVCLVDRRAVDVRRPCWRRTRAGSSASDDDCDELSTRRRPRAGPPTASAGSGSRGRGARRRPPPRCGGGVISVCGCVSVNDLTIRAAIIAGLAIVALVLTGWRKTARATPKTSRGTATTPRQVPVRGGSRADAGVSPAQPGAAAVSLLDERRARLVVGAVIATVSAFADRRDRHDDDEPAQGLTACVTDADAAGASAAGRSTDRRPGERARRPGSGRGRADPGCAPLRSAPSSGSVPATDGDVIDGARRCRSRRPAPGRDDRRPPPGVDLARRARRPRCDRSSRSPRGRAASARRRRRRARPADRAGDGGAADPLVRESSVAALGAIGDDRGLDAILAATGDKPAIRRRAVLALAPFLDPTTLGPTRSTRRCSARSPTATGRSAKPPRTSSPGRLTVFELGGRAACATGYGPQATARLGASASVYR